MNKDDLIHMKNWFTGYVACYYTDDEDFNRTIRLKEEHTKRVCMNSVMLGKELDLSEQDIILAETMALFHDIGRFEQYAVYGTFVDMASENHAILGLRQIKKHQTLSVCTKDEKRFIVRAIRYHNTAVLPENEDNKSLLFMRLLRDADKLDIWKVVTDYYHERDGNRNRAVEIGLADNPEYSNNIIKALLEKKIARIQDLKTLNDFKLLQISWVFDLNFAPSFKAVQNYQYIEQIEATLPQTEEVIRAVKKARDHVDAFI